MGKFFLSVLIGIIAMLLVNGDTQAALGEAASSLASALTAAVGR